MLVKELIEKLGLCDPDTEVQISRKIDTEQVIIQDIQFVSISISKAFPRAYINIAREGG